MDKCRLCLKNSKKLRSIFAKEDGVLYIDMITSISNIKINREDEVKNLCSQCRRKLKEAFDFKNMIEMSDSVFSKETLRRINFNNLDEIKIKVEIDVKNEINKNNCSISVLENCDNNGEEFFFNNTIIKKIEPSNTVCNNQTSNIHDYVELIKDEPNDDHMDEHMEYDYDCEDEYVPHKNIYRKQKKCSKGKENTVAKRRKKSDMMVAKKVCIKPVFLEDIGIVRTKVDIKRKRKPKSTAPIKIKKQMCNFCGIMTSSMKSHLLTHTGKKTHKCDKCDKAFFTPWRLQHHMKKHEYRKYRCDQCVARFHEASALTRHLAVHNEEKKFMCEFCNKSYKRISTLNRHKLQHNSANKNIKCDHCNMTFFTKVNLRHHLRVHTGERPFRCEMCSQGYSYKHDFNRHCFKKHGVFLKRRSVYVMNEEVLVKERELMRALMLRLRGVVQGEDPFKEFEGPQGYIGLQQAIKLLENKQLPVDVHY